MFLSRKLYLVVLSILLFAFHSLNLFSQDKTIDSIQNALKNADDTTQVLLLNKLSKKVKNSDLGSALKHAQAASAISLRINYAKGIKLSMASEAEVLFAREQNKQALQKYEDLLKLCYSDNDIDGIISCQNSIAEIYVIEGEYDKAIQLLNYILSNYKDVISLEQKIITCNFLASSYYFKNDYSNAIGNYIQAAELAEKKNDLPAQAQALLNMGNIYLTQKQYKEAEKYYSDALKINLKTNDRPEQALCYNNIGYTYNSRNDFDKALEFYQKSLQIREELHDTKGIAKSFNNIGVAYDKKGDFKKSLEYFKKSLVINEELGNAIGVAKLQLNIGVAYNKIKNYKVGAEYIEKSIQYFEEVNNVELQQVAYEELSGAYYELGNFKLSHDYLEKSATLKDSIFNQEQTSAIAEMQSKYDSEKKEKEIELLTTSQELNNSKIKQQQFLNILVIVALLAVIVIAIFIYRGYKNKQKTSEHLAQINAVLEKLSIVAEKTDNGVVIANEKGDIEWINEGFTRLLGYNLEEFIKAKGSSILTASNNPEITEHLNKINIEKKSIVYENLTTKKSGEQIWLQSTLTPIIDESQKLRKIVIIDTDITKQKLAEEEIRHKNEETTSSIKYAKKIQEAILPKTEKILESFPQSFILYKPKDIVSGDFYWYYDKNEIYSFIAAVDCTGHGVPGAFMSMIGSNILNQIAGESVISTPAFVLDQLHDEITKALKQNVPGSESRDGMDIALCRYNKATRQLDYAGANRPLYLLRKGEIIEYTANKQPIGGLHSIDRKKFNNHTIELLDGDHVYIFSDGYADQFGGIAGKKYMTKNFKRFLLENVKYSITEQKRRLDEEFEGWRGENEQVDDILVIGIKA